MPNMHYLLINQNAVNLTHFIPTTTVVVVQFVVVTLSIPTGVYAAENAVLH